ncbi:MAG: 50S ribosomal protein L11 methyltransferase, partial [Oscillospiraceae bacterium]|nr:50S ribosomal protein L11 methyltransferase [Oscillospiraceae bacterium]
MQWLELTIHTRSEELDELTARLTALGYDSFIIEDEQDFLRFLEQNHAYWDYVDEALEESMRGISQVRLYLEDDDGAQAQIAALREAVGSAQELTVRTVADEDWENSWKRYYRPLAIGKRLLIVPQWLQPDNP